MSGYVEAGYAVILVTLGSYSASLVARDKAARRRLPGAARDRTEKSPPGPGGGRA